MDKQQFLAMSAITDLKGFVDGRSTNVGRTMYTLHSVPNKCKTVQIASTMDEDEFYVEIYKFKPILHPLSDFIKEIEHNGDRFVPVNKISKMVDEEDFSFDKGGPEMDELTEELIAPLFLTMWLTEHHFDIAHLIENGEAIDVNALDINPYK